jgi:hypothetical protein
MEVQSECDGVAMEQVEEVEEVVEVSERERISWAGLREARA